MDLLEKIRRAQTNAAEQAVVDHLQSQGIIATPEHTAESQVKPLPFAVFDEFGRGADDRVSEYVSQVVAQTKNLLSESQSLIAEQAKRISALESRRWNSAPARCPFTGLPHFVDIEHPTLGWIATYGGPYDSYTIPQRDDGNSEYYRYRFDHDEGAWIEEAECIGLKLVSDQLYTSEDDPAELRAEVEQLRAQLSTASAVSPAKR